MHDSLCPGPEFPAGGLRRGIIGIGAACAALGLTVLIGWHFHSVAVVQLRPNLPPMQYNTAAGFLLAGLALALWAWGRAPVAPPILGTLVAIIGSITSGEYLFHGDAGLDRALYPGYVPAAALQIDRMSPVSAVCLMLCGVALLCLGTTAFKRWRLGVAGTLGAVILGMMLVAIAGFVFNPPREIGWERLNILAIHTSIGFTLVGTGLLLIAWHLRAQPGERTPGWLPVWLTAAVFTVSLFVYFALYAKQNDEINAAIRTGAASVKDQIETRIEGRMRSLVRMAERFELSGGAPNAAWDADAANYVHDSPDLQALEWIDTTHNIRWIVPLRGNAAKLNLNLVKETHRKAALERAGQERQPAVTPVIPLFRGGLGFVMYVPLIENGRPASFLAAVVNAKDYLQKYLPPTVAPGEAVRVSDNGRVFYERDAGTPGRTWVDDTIELHGATWEFRMWPTPALAATLYSPLPQFVLIAGALGGLMIGIACYFAQRSSRQATETAHANAALQAAFDKVKTLEGLLPICSSCKRVRDDTGYWSKIDTYLQEHTNASLSHGYCPACAVVAFKEFGLEVPAEVQATLDAGNFE